MSSTYARIGQSAPSQQATNGAMDMFVDGHQCQNRGLQLFGLEVLRGATEAQVQTAIRFVHASRRVPIGTIEAMFAEPTYTAL